jgi:hypothetical protein
VGEAALEGLGVVEATEDAELDDLNGFQSEKLGVALPLVQPESPATANTTSAYRAKDLRMVFCL